MSLLVRPWLGCYQTCLPFLLLTSAPPPLFSHSQSMSAYHRMSNSFHMDTRGWVVKVLRLSTTNIYNSQQSIQQWLNYESKFIPVMLQAKIPTSSGTEVSNWPTCVFEWIVLVPPINAKGCNHMISADLQIWLQCKLTSRKKFITKATNRDKDIYKTTEKQCKVQLAI